MNQTRFALFCDRAHTMPEATVVDVPAVNTRIEVEEVRVIGIAARRRTPIVTVGTCVVKRRPVAVARSR